MRHVKTVTMAFIVCALCVLASSTVAHADLPSFLRMKNGDIEDGNALLEKGDAKGALEAYDRAARELPHAPGVQLDRGLALLKLGELPKAKEALLAATAPNAPTDVRADAYQNLALAHYREADALAQQKKHDEAQKAFGESVDAAKRSLRLRPGDPNAAWNLELAARRVREEQQKQKEEQEKQKQDQKDKGEDQQKQDQQGGEPNPDQNGDPKDQEQDPSQGDENKQKPEDKPGDQGKDQAKKDEPKPPEPAKDKPSEAQKQEQAKRDAEKAAAAEKDQAGQDKPLPADVEHALDALQDGEENFERVRARQRAQQERRAPEKDW